ncbi:MAG: hypothetical protein IPH04_16050 [Saprospirales bacterium]|jgi:hypothetical protein|nr:hypothetical protein [Saprospirales bacterium]
MTAQAISLNEREAIQKYFGKALEELTIQEFQRIRKELRSKFHPDNFEKFEDDTVREMATERFQHIEGLTEKMEAYFQGELPAQGEGAPVSTPASYAFDGMKIEILTTDKDLKYDLFGSFYKWLRLGEQFKIPHTANAYIIMDEDHRGVRIGYSETIRMYLTFGVDDAIEDIVEWFFQRIHGRAMGLLIHGQKIEVDYNAILGAVRKPSLLLA